MNTGQTFLRVMDEGGQRFLQFASKTYSEPSGKMKITLLPAVHLANMDFYKRHIEILNEADIVLYEGKGLDSAGLEWSSLPVVKKHNRSTFHVLLAKAYNLLYQLDVINYREAHFVHADYSFTEEISDPNDRLNKIEQGIELYNEKYSKEAVDEQFEDGFDYFVNKQIESFRNEQSLKEMVEQLVAIQTKGYEKFLKENLPPEEFEREFTNRNKIVLSKLAEQVVGMSESSTSHLVIYYGSGHMPYFESQIAEKYNLALESEEWISAFSY